MTHQAVIYRNRKKGGWSLLPQVVYFFHLFLILNLTHIKSEGQLEKPYYNIET